MQMYDDQRGAQRIATFKRNSRRSAIRNFIRYNINASMPRHTDLGVK